MQGGGRHRTFHDNPRMQPPDVARWTRRTATTALWALAVGSIVFWGLRLAAPPAAAAYAPLASAPAPQADPIAVGRALGAVTDAPAAVSAAPTRFTLLGVVAGRSSGGTALIAVDGQPARPFRVGSTVVPGVVLQSVGPRRAYLGGDGVAAVTLEMPVLK